jgi:hypothetical protein
MRCLTRGGVSKSATSALRLAIMPKHTVLPIGTNSIGSAITITWSTAVFYLSLSRVADWTRRWPRATSLVGILRYETHYTGLSSHVHVWLVSA